MRQSDPDLMGGMRVVENSPRKIVFQRRRRIWRRLVLPAVVFVPLGLIAATDGEPIDAGAVVIFLILIAVFAPGLLATWRPCWIRLDRAAGTLRWSGSVSLSESAGSLRTADIEKFATHYVIERENWTTSVAAQLRGPDALQVLHFDLSKKSATHLVDALNAWIADNQEKSAT